jgi:hypothetical protein
LIEGTTGVEKNKEPPVKVKSLVHKLLDTFRDIREVTLSSPCLWASFYFLFFLFGAHNS